MNNVLVEFFSKYITLTPEEENAIKNLNIIKVYPKNTLLLKEGQITDKGFLVLKGCIRVFFNIDGEEKTTEIYTEMEAICPACTFNNLPSEYNIDCLENSIIAVGDSEMGNKINEQFPRFETVCRLASEEQLLQSQFSINSFKIHSPEKRYKLLQDARPDLIQRVPQNIIASYLGITPQSLSRIRARMKNNKEKMAIV
jgi:CRP-like cAMP-binding protein